MYDENGTVTTSIVAVPFLVIAILLLYQPKVLLKKCFQLFNYSLLLLVTRTSAAETGNRGHQTVNICAGCFQNTITESILNKLSCFLFFQIFFGFFL